MTRGRYGVVRALVHLALALVAFAAPAAARPRLVWAFGDSLTAGYGLPPSQGFTSQLQARLRSAGLDVEVRNGGISGDTTAQGRARLLWGLRGIGRAPDLVVVELGANDMLRGLPPAQTEANLAVILAALRDRHIPVLLAGMKAQRNLGASYVSAFDGLYPRLARQFGVRLYPFFLDGVAGDRSLVQADGLHPNARGVGIITARILPTVAGALAVQSPAAKHVMPRPRPAG